MTRGSEMFILCRGNFSSERYQFSWREWQLERGFLINFTGDRLNWQSMCRNKCFFFTKSLPEFSQKYLFLSRICRAKKYYSEVKLFSLAYRWESITRPVLVATCRILKNNPLIPPPTSFVANFALHSDSTTSFAKAMDCCFIHCGWRSLQKV